MAAKRTGKSKTVPRTDLPALKRDRLFIKDWLEAHRMNKAIDKDTRQR